MTKKLRIRVELNKGRIGVPLYKLAAISEEIDKFLKMLSEDVTIDIEKGQWLALNFENSSCIYDVEFVGETTELQRKDYFYYSEQIMENPYKAINGRIRHKTILQYATIAKHLDADEPMGLGVYKEKDKLPPVHTLSREIATEVVEAIEETIEYYGAMRGIVENIFQLGGDKPYLKIRDVITGRLVDCFFAPVLYNVVIKLLERRKGILNVSGLIRANRLEHRLESIIVNVDDKIELAEEYQPGDLDKFFGSIPDILEDMTLEQYMDDVRGRSE